MLHQTYATPGAIANDRFRVNTALQTYKSHLPMRSHREDRAVIVRLTSALVTRPIAERSQRLVSLARVMEQLHPDRPLSRGYAMVLDANGQAITSAPAAAKEALLAIKFADGIVQTSPTTAASGAKRPAKPPVPKPGREQSELF